jgi:hypothetical protein
MGNRFEGEKNDQITDLAEPQILAGCPGIAEQIALAFGVFIVVRRTQAIYFTGRDTDRLSSHCRLGLHRGIVDGTALCRMFNLTFGTDRHMSLT